MNTRIIRELKDVDRSSPSWKEAMALGFYKHEPLKDASRQIRLMRVLDRFCNWGEGEFIKCTVETFDLDDDDRPPYEALSYVWQQPYPCWSPPLPTLSPQPLMPVPPLLPVDAAVRPHRVPRRRHSDSSVVHPPDGLASDGLALPHSPAFIEDNRPAPPPGHLDHGPQIASFPRSNNEGPHPNPRLPTEPASGEDPALPSARVILIDGKPFQLQENLWRFLHRVRRNPILDIKNRASHFPFYRYGLAFGYLWIDQICIDQTSKQEKANQVQRMAEIFKAADRAIIWLGDTTPNSHAILSYLVSPPDWIPVKCVDDPERAGDDVACNGMIHEFYELPYWARLWVVQEFAVAKDLVLMWGQDFLRWEDFRHISWRDHFEFIPEHLKYAGGVEEACDLRASRWHGNNHVYTVDRPRNTLVAVMNRFIERKTEIALDRVYGLLAVARMEDQVEVNYDTPANELFWGILHILMRARGASRNFEWMIHRIGLALGVTGTEQALQDPAIKKAAHLAFGNGSPVDLRRVFKEKSRDYGPKFGFTSFVCYCPSETSLNSDLHDMAACAERTYQHNLAMERSIVDRQAS